MVHHSIAVVIASFLTNFSERRQREVRLSLGPMAPSRTASSARLRLRRFMGLGPLTPAPSCMAESRFG